MARKRLLVLITMFGFFWATHSAYAEAEKPSKTLTILYSNNVNGEINPCPT